MSMRIGCMARRSRIAAVRVASPRKRPQSLSPMFEVTAVETRPWRRSTRLYRGVSGGRLIATLLDLAEPEVVNDQEIGTSPGLEATG
jgi:hypothetical protein